MSGDLGNLSVGVLAFEFNYIFSPFLLLSQCNRPSLSGTLRWGRLPVRHVVVEVESPSSSLVPRAQTNQPRAPRGCVCFVSFMDVCDFFFQATKGLEKGTGNCICGKIEQTGLSRSCMDRWTDGRGCPREQYDSRRLAGSVCCRTLRPVLKYCRGLDAWGAAILGQE